MSCRKYSRQYLTDSLSDFWFWSAFTLVVLPAVRPVIRPEAAAASPGGMSMIISGVMIPMPVVRVTTWVAHNVESCLSRSETGQGKRSILTTQIMTRTTIKASTLKAKPITDADTPHLDSKAENLGLEPILVRQRQCLRLLPDTLPQSAIWSLVDIRHFSQPCHCHPPSL